VTDEADDQAAQEPKPRRPQKRDHTDIRQFCWLVASGNTQTESAKQAAIRTPEFDDYPSDALAAQRANKLMKRADVVELIATLKAQVDADMAAKYSVSRESLIRDAIEVKQRCMQAEPVLDREGNPTGEWTFKAREALAAIELLGREVNAFSLKVKHEHTLNDLTDEQLIQRARAAYLKRTAIEAAIAGGESGADRGDPGDGGASSTALN
jgi:phage terminase small subunit